MKEKTFSYELEKSYYGHNWPTEPQPYGHLEKYVRCVLDPQELFTDKRVLDVGAGECTCTRLIADRFGPKEVVACELFKERMLPAMRANQNPRLKFVEGSILSLPFDDGAFDVVWGTLILHQIPDLGKALNEINRVLKRNGIYAGWEPNPFNPVILHRYLFKPHSQNQYLFWPWKIRREFESKGFQIQIIYFYSKFPNIKNRFLATCEGIVATKL